MTICETTGAGVGLKRDRPTEVSGKRTGACRFRIRHAGEVRIGRRRDDSTITASVRTCVNKYGTRELEVILVVWLTRTCLPLVRGRMDALDRFLISGELSLERRDQKVVPGGGRWRQRARNRLLPLCRFSSRSLFVRSNLVDRFESRRSRARMSIGCRTTCKVKGVIVVCYSLMLTAGSSRGRFL